MMSALPFIPAALSMAGSLFGAAGRDKKRYQPEQTHSYQGYAALPPEAQKLWQQQFQRMGGAEQFDPNTMRYAQRPNDMFGSQELFNLQQRYPNQGVQQVGVQEPLHAFERTALSQYGNPDFSQEGLQPYEQAFEPDRKLLTGEINRNADRMRSQQAGAYGANDPTGLNIGSSPERITDMLMQQERQRRLDQMNFDIRNSALGLRESSLANMLGAGGQIRGQNQEQLNNASGQGMAQNSRQNQFMQYMLAILQGLPGSQSSSTIGAYPAQPGFLQKFGAGLQGAGDMMGKQNYFGGGGK